MARAVAVEAITARGTTPEQEGDAAAVGTERDLIPARKAGFVAHVTAPVMVLATVRAQDTVPVTVQVMAAGAAGCVPPASLEFRSQPLMSRVAAPLPSPLPRSRSLTCGCASRRWHIA